MINHSVGTNTQNATWKYHPSYNAVQINMDNPTANVPTPNVIYDYPKADGQIYYPVIQPTMAGKITRTPSGVEDYNNYLEYDKFGNEVASINYQKEGDAIVQKIKTTSPDGTVLEKTLKNSPNFKNSNIVIKDKDGNVLLLKEKSVTKIDNDKSQTVVNGKVYNVSGLQGDVLTVEHNGAIATIDLNKMLNPDVKLLRECVSPDNLPIRDSKINNEEKEKLFNRIKSLSGDDLFRLSQSVEHIQFLDDKSIEAFFVPNGNTLLLSPKDWENTHLITSHELGHAIYNQNVRRLKLDDSQFKTIRNYEKQNFEQHKSNTRGEELLGSKFLFGNPDMNWKDVDEVADDDEYLRDETFAESYNNLNTMDIVHYDNEVLPLRTLALFRYLPRTMAEVEKLA